MATPSLNDLFTAISANFKSKFGISSSNDLKRTLTALAASDAGMLKLLYMQLADVQKNIWPDTADSEDNGGTLERFGRVKLQRNPYPATQGEYQILITGVAGSIIKAGTQFYSKINSTIQQAVFEAENDLTLSNTTGYITVLCNKAGTDYSLSVNDTLYLVSPIIGIQDTATVSAVIEIATNKEDIEIYRELILDSFRLEANGGSASDYMLWALDVAGIRRVYPYTTPGASGSNEIYAEATLDASTDGNGTPSQTLLDALWKSDNTGVFEIDPDTTLDEYQRGRRQLGLPEIVLKPIVLKPVVIKIVNLKTQTTSVKTAISTSISDFLYNIRPFVPGFSDPNNPKDTLYLSDISRIISDTVEEGNTFDNIVVTCAGLSTPYKFIFGAIPYLSEITYE